MADLESVGLGKTPRELYLSYLRKMPPHLQKEICQDKRIWPGDTKDIGLRSPQTWEECHKVVLEYEQREAAHRAVAHSTYSTTPGEPSDPSAALAKAQKEIRELKAAAKAAAARTPGAAARKGANCDMVHSLLAGQGQALPANWGPPSGASMSNPFAAFSIQIGSAGVQAGLPAADPKGAVREHALALKKGESGRFSALDELPGDWWSLAENEPGGYQYRTVVQVLGISASSACSTGAPGRTMSPRSSWSACLTARPSSESGRRTPGFLW